MRFVEFKLKVPIKERPGEFNEYIFNSPTILCEKLDISRASLYAICNGTFRFSHSKIKHLEGIIIEKCSLVSEKKMQSLQEKEEKQLEKKKLQQEKTQKKIDEENEINRKRDEFLSNLNQL